MSISEIRFNEITTVPGELEHIADSLANGHISANGPYSEKAREILKGWHDAPEVLLTTSCTDALELAALMLNIEPGQKVIVPSFTFVSTALAFVRSGALIAFADIDPVTLALDPDSVKALMDDDVTGVVTVHYGGIAGDVDGLMDVLPDHVSLIEDNAHGLLARHNGQPLGTFGRFSTLSFHETKNFTCGEGGALVINETGDVDRSRVLFDKGTNRREFMLGQVNKYEWKDIGSSFGLSDILAAKLLVQLEAADEIQARRQDVFEAYMKGLTPFMGELEIQLPAPQPDSVPGYHMFHVLVRDRVTRDALMAAMRQSGIAVGFHFIPLHSSAGAERFGAGRFECPVADDVASRLLRLPFHAGLSEADIDRVVTTLIAELRTLVGAS